MPINLSLRQVSESDFDQLVELRIAAMRDSLERLGRFDPARARERLRKTFVPEVTKHILSDSHCAGFYAMREIDQRFSLDHFYIHPEFQNQGIGSWALRTVLKEAETRKMPIVVGALRGSDSNRFYQRHGFKKSSEDEWDIYYLYEVKISETSSLSPTYP